MFYLLFIPAVLLASQGDRGGADHPPDQQRSLAKGVLGQGGFGVAVEGGADAVSVPSCLVMHSLRSPASRLQGWGWYRDWITGGGGFS